MSHGFDLLTLFTFRLCIFNKLHYVWFHLHERANIMVNKIIISRLNPWLKTEEVVLEKEI
jgi:hypothetical protein